MAHSIATCFKILAVPVSRPVAERRMNEDRIWSRDFGSSALRLYRYRIATARASPSRKDPSLIRPPRTTDPNTIGRAADPVRYRYSL
ncbi:unnamed protein product [Haemonchus placei]|uniref:Secreted protein n=1 Tax=Haemonchus placei TaxID=6290 RepID=A0A0N4X0R9_HAEPC|nr:unnamed protein product [Haemonchus placei]